MVVAYGLRTEWSPACRRTRQRAVSHSGLGQMVGRLILYGALALAIGIVVVSACGPEPQTQGSPTPAPATSASRSITPTTAPTSLATASTRPSPSVTSVPTVAPSPGASPAAACPRSTGGNPSNHANLAAAPDAHPPAFDRPVSISAQGPRHGCRESPASTAEAASPPAAAPSNPVSPIKHAHHGPNLTRDCFDSVEPIRD